MLILTRRIGESIIIADVTKVIVLGAIGNQIKLGINAPTDIEVHREEVYERIKKITHYQESQHDMENHTCLPTIYCSK